MSAANWITLFGIIVAAVVALAVAFMHRKQMRQIELYRADPTVPLVPPLHPVTRFLKSYGFYGWCLAWAAYDVFVLVRDLRETTPVTREVVVKIVVDIFGIVLMVMIGLGSFMSERVYQIAEKLVGILEKMTEGRQWTIDTTEKMAEKINQLEKGGPKSAA